MVSTKQNTTVAHFWNLELHRRCTKTHLKWYPPTQPKFSWSWIYRFIVEFWSPFVLREKTENESSLVSSFQQKSSQKIVHPETAWNCHYKSVHLADGWILKICFFPSIYTSTHENWIPACLWEQIVSSYKSITHLFGNTLSPSTMSGHDLAQ